MSQSSVKTAAEDLHSSRKTISLRRNFSWAFLGNATYAGCQWIILVIFAKLGTPELVGLFALGLALSAPIFLLTGLNLRAVQATDAKNDFCFEEYLGVQVLAGFLAFFLTILIAAMAGYGTVMILVATVIAFHKFIEAVDNALYGFFQKSEQMNFIASSLMLKGIMNIIVVYTVMSTTDSLILSILALSISSMTILLMYDRMNMKKLYVMSMEKIRGIKITRIKKLVYVSVPLGLVMMANSLNVNVPRYVLESSFTKHELGIFAAMAYILVTGTMVITALGQSASPRLAKYYAEKKYKSFRRLLFILLVIAAVLGLVAFLVAKYFGGFILQIVYTAEYAKYSNEFTWIMLASGFSFISSVLGYAITATRQFRVQVPITFFSLAVAIAGSLVLIPQGGIQGAVWTTLLIFASQIPLKFLVIFRTLRQA